MGAVLDLIRNVARTLEIEANAVSDNPLLFGDEAISGGNFHAEPVAFAADILAMALCEIGSLSERRLAVLVDPKMSGLPAFLIADSGVNSGFMILQVTAAALVSENKSLALSGQRRFDPDLGGPGGPCLDGDARRAEGAADRPQCGGRGRHRIAGGRAGRGFPRAAGDLGRARSGAGRDPRGSALP